MTTSFAFVLSLALLGSQPAVPADTVTTEHYRIYTGDGQAVSWDDLIASAAVADVILVGETHDDPVAHHIEIEVLRAALADSVRGSAASMEMFTRDVQPILDEYLAGLVTERHFRAASEPWTNYETDYRPFVEAAREAGRPVIAANAPRRYVNRVSRLGPESLQDLPEASLEWIAPLPFALASEAYRAEWNALMMEAMAQSQDSSEVERYPEVEEGAEHHAAGEDHGGEHAAGEEEAGEGHEAMHAEHHAAGEEEHQAEPEDDAASGTHGSGGAAGSMDNILHAQSLWDATMAYSIVDYLTRNPGDRVVHIVGSFHVKNFTGIPEHIERYRPGTSVVVIVVEPAEDIEAFDPDEHGGAGSFVILADEALPRTYDASAGQ